MLKLIIEDDEGRKTVVPFVRDEITIGRQEGNTIRLTERNVSRRHARLVRQNGHVLVEDLGSYNGIRINGDKIQGQVPVHEGDLIQIGDYDLAVQSEAQVAASTSSTAPLPPVGAATQTMNADVDPLERTSPPARGNGHANHSAMTVKLPDINATSPDLPVVDEGNSDDGPEEADPNDVQSASGETETGRRQSTAIIRMDQIESNRPRQIVDIDPSEAPRLVVLNTDFAGREFACIRTELKIGRTEDNDIAIDHRSLSRTHCKIVREDTGEWRVVDMQSANGLMVNGEPYAQSALRTGDTLELGHVKFKFVGPGESFTLSETAEGVQVSAGGGSKIPMIAAFLLVLCAVGGGGYWFVIRKKPPVIPPKVVEVVDVDVPRPPDPQPPEVVVKPPVVVPVEPTQEQIVADREKKIVKAKQHIEDLEWTQAIEELRSCASPCPEAKPLLAALGQEKQMKIALENAERLLENHQLLKAKDELDLASNSKLLSNTKRFLAARTRLQEESQREVPTNPRPPVVVVPPPEPPKPVVDPRIAEAGTLLDEAKALMKEKQYPSAKSKLEKCVKLLPKMADCHKLLGTSWAKMGEPDKGLRAYKEFIKLASPDHPDFDKVKKIIDTYEGGSK